MPLLVASYNYEQILVLGSEGWGWECGIQKEEVHGSWSCPLEAFRPLRNSSDKHRTPTDRKGKLFQLSIKMICKSWQEGKKVGDGDQSGRFRKGFLDRGTGCRIGLRRSRGSRQDRKEWGGHHWEGRYLLKPKAHPRKCKSGCKELS